MHQVNSIFHQKLQKIVLTSRFELKWPFLCAARLITLFLFLQRRFVFRMNIFTFVSPSVAFFGVLFRIRQTRWGKFDKSGRTDRHSMLVYDTPLTHLFDPNCNLKLNVELNSLEPVYTAILLAIHSVRSFNCFVVWLRMW